jgi:four helix bundle protein
LIIAIKRKHLGRKPKIKNMDKPTIQQKSRDYAIRIINCYKYLTEEKHETVMSKQLLRCGTSIGANTRESKNAQSRMDFLNKLNIALKEADETEYWLDLLHETKYIDDKLFQSLLNDCKEIIAILVSIIKKLKEID